MSNPRRVTLVGTPEDTAWRDLVAGSIDVALRAEAPTFISVAQDRGKMEFTGFPHRRMKNVETFRLELLPERAEPDAPLTP